MSKKIFVNLPVENLTRSKEFFGELGFEFDTRFCDDTAACMVISDNIFCMLLTKPKFQGFSPNPICDANQQTEVLIAITAANRDEVDLLVSKAIKAGGKTYSNPQDHGFMYSHGFQDLDGHVWEVFYMDMQTAE
jgi:uncharacterized protein